MFIFLSSGFLNSTGVMIIHLGSNLLVIGVELGYWLCLGNYHFYTKEKL